MEPYIMLPPAFSNEPLPNVEREDIASTPTPAVRAMKLFLSLHFNPRDPDWAKLTDGLTAETAGVWGHNLQLRQADLLALGEKGMTKLAKKRAKAPIDPMNLFAAFGHDACDANATATPIDPVLGK
jgi:hypothetical protein